MDSLTLDRKRLAFLIAVPLAWAVLLTFHGSPEPDDVYGSLQDEATKWLVVHGGTLVFIGLMGWALFLLVEDLPGRAARISRLAIGPFVLFYGAGEAVLGIATGILVEHANDVPPDERAGAVGAVQELWDNTITDDVLLTLGSAAWIVAVVGAAVACQIALLCFAAAAALLARSRKPSAVPAL